MNKTYQDLNAAKSKLTERDQVFAQSLLDGFDKWHRFSDKQQYWVNTLVARAEGAAPKMEDRINLTGVVKLLRTAEANGLKRPKIRLDLTDTSVMALSLAAPNSRNPGFVYVKVNGEYSGKVAPDGAFTGNPTVGHALKSLAEDPAKRAAAYGHRTGRCCFCSLPLTDGRSIAVGYGPICADHYGLPWGDVRVETFVKEEGPLAVAPLPARTETPSPRQERAIPAPIASTPEGRAFVRSFVDPQFNDEIGELA